MAFDAAFDHLHRDMRVLLREPNLHFDGAVDQLARQRLLRIDERSFLDSARSLRNFLAHSHDLIAQRLVTIEIDHAVPERLIRIADRLSRRVPATRYMVPWSKVRCGALEEYVEPLMAEMIDRDFSHIPIVVNGLVVCIFDERSLFRALARDRLDSIFPETKLNDIVEPVAFAESDPKEAGVIFIERGASLNDLRERVDAAAQESDLITLIIFTERGDPNETPIGLCTVWDLPR